MKRIKQYGGKPTIKPRRFVVKSQKFLAVLLACALLVGIVPAFSAFAAAGEITGITIKGFETDLSGGNTNFGGVVAKPILLTSTTAAGDGAIVLVYDSGSGGLAYHVEAANVEDVTQWDSNTEDGVLDLGTVYSNGALLAGDAIFVKDNQTTAVFFKFVVDIDSDVAKAVALLPTGAITTLTVEGGTGGTNAAKSAAIKTHLEGLTGMSALGVTISVNFVNSKFIATVTKGGLSDKKEITVTTWKSFEEVANDDISAAFELIDNDTAGDNTDDDKSVYASLTFAGGSAATNTAKVNELLRVLGLIAGMGDLEVALSAISVDGTNFVVTIAKTPGTARAIDVIVEKWLAPEDAKITAAKSAIEGKSLATMTVAGGITSGNTAREDAVVEELNKLPAVKDEGITLTATTGDGNSFIITINKSPGAQQFTTKTVTTWRAPEDVKIDEAIAKITPTALTKVGITSPATATDAQKAAAVKEYVEKLSGMAELGVTISVVANSPIGTPNGFVVTVAKSPGTAQTKAVTVALAEWVTPTEAADADIAAVISVLNGLPAFPELLIAGGAKADSSAKIAALIKELEKNATVKARGVTLSAVASPDSLSFLVTVAKLPGTPKSATVTVTKWVAPEDADIAAALLEIPATIPALAATGGDTTPFTARINALIEHLNAIMEKEEIDGIVFTATSENGTLFKVKVNKEPGAEKEVNVTVSSWVTPENAAITSAKALIAAEGTIPYLAIAGGALSLNPERESALVAYLGTLKGMDELGVTLSAATSNGTNFTVTIKKTGGTDQTQSVTVSDWKTPADAATADIIAANALITSDTIPTLAVAGGTKAEPDAKLEAFLAHLNKITGMAKLGVTINAVTLDGKDFIVSITKTGGTTIVRTMDVDTWTNKDDKDIADALALVLTPIAKVEVVGGAEASNAEKAAAIKAHLDAVKKIADLGVTIAVEYAAATTNWKVTITKGTGTAGVKNVDVTAWTAKEPGDTTSPTWSLDIANVDGLVNAPLTGIIYVDFDELMDKTVGSVTFNEKTYSAADLVDSWGTITNNDNIVVADFISIAYSGLKNGTKYEVKVVGFKDKAGNALAGPDTLSFTTVAASTSTGGGDTGGGGGGGGSSAPAAPKEPEIKPATTPKEQVSNVYQVAFGRTADTAGLEHWVDLMTTKGWTPEQVITALLNSEEALARNWTNDEYVTILYKLLFGRNPDPGGLTNWLSHLAAGKTRGWVLERFFASEEWNGVKANFMK